MATPRQIEANQKNAKRSTGPRTDLGKERSRTNSMLHGMAGSGVVLPDEEMEAVRRRMEAWRSSYRLGCFEDEWVYEQMVISTVRIDRCQKEGMTVRSTEASRAVLSWEEDRAREAETIGARLAKRPSIVARELLRTTQGCDWLLGRWRALGAALLGEGAGGTWTAAQKSLAFDLLGIPTDLRPRPESLPDDPRALVASEVERLERYQLEALETLDELERASAELGLSGTPSRPELLLRRYEAASFKILQWARTRLQECRRVAPAPTATERVEAPRPTPVFAPVPAPIPVREPAPAPVVAKPPEPKPEPVAASVLPPPASVVTAPVDDHAKAVDQTRLDRPVVAVLAVSTGCASPAPAPTWGNRRARKAARRRAAG
jgi:hypothetical protein